MVRILLSFCLLFVADLFCIAHQWEEFVRKRYEPTYKDSEYYRKYDENTDEGVKEFYFQNHKHQSMDFVLKKEREYLSLLKSMSIWDAIALLDTIVDESDPDLNLPQSYHLFQTAEALRKDGHPRWLILTGFLHDLGKILIAYGEPQWAVVGDTFPVGCAYASQVVFSEYFRENLDYDHPIYQTRLGIYEEGCGLDHVHMSWGHDEYLYQVLKDYLPEPALYIIRYHSFYSAHEEGAYQYLLSEKDRELLPWLELFGQYDLYSKDPENLSMETLYPYYEELIDEFLPKELKW